MFAKQFLEDTALSICTIKDGDVGIRTILPHMQMLDLIHDNRAFLGITVRREHLQGLSFFFPRVNILMYLSGILCDQAVRCPDDRLGRPIVLLQLE